MSLPNLRSRTILVVEDHPDSREMLRITLEEAGARVLTAEEGGQALRVVREEEAPDVILCDLAMPGMGGFTFCEKARADPLLSRAKIIAVTGSHADRDYLATMTAGFDAHVTKPFDAETLGAVLRRVLPGRQK